MILTATQKAQQFARIHEIVMDVRKHAQDTHDVAEAYDRIEAIVNEDSE